jgi:hypothetical protein
VRSLCSNARTSEWSETVTLPADKTSTKSEDPKARIATPLNTDPPSITNTTPIDKVLNPFDIPVSSEDIDEAAIKKRISEITDLSLTDNTQRCGYAISRDLTCDLTPLPNADTGIDFTNPKGKYVYINGYEILVTRDAGAGSHTGEGLLYYPYLKTRIPVAWSGASIKKATDGDYGCLSPEVIAIGSQNGVVAADYRQQVIDLLTSGPHAYSGNLKGALAELKKVVADLNAGRTIDPAYAKSVIDAAQKGIEEWKTTVSKYFTNGTAPLPPEVQQILNSIEAIKTSLNAPKDCLAQNIPTTTSPSGRNNIIRLFPIDACTLSEEQKNILQASLGGIEQNSNEIALLEKKIENLRLPNEFSVIGQNNNLMYGLSQKLLLDDRTNPNTEDAQYHVNMEPKTNDGKKYFKEITTIWNVRDKLKSSVKLYLSDFFVPQPIQTEIDKLNGRLLVLPNLLSTGIFTTYDENYVKDFFLQKIKGNRTTNDNNLVSMYSSSKKGLYEGAGEDLLNNFFSKTGNPYYHTKTIADAIYSTEVGKRRIENAISVIDQMFYLKIGKYFKMSDFNLNNYKTGFTIIDNNAVGASTFPNIFPNFGISNAIDNDESLFGLLCIGGVQGTEIRLKELTPIIQKVGSITTRGYEAKIILQYKDTFGVSEIDYTKPLSLGFDIGWINFVKYNYRAGVLAQWILQHQYGYKTFNDYLTYEITMKRTWIQE